MSLSEARAGGPSQASGTHTDPRGSRAPWTLELQPPCLRLRGGLAPQAATQPQIPNLCSYRKSKDLHKRLKAAVFLTRRPALGLTAETHIPFTVPSAEYSVDARLRQWRLSLVRRAALLKDSEERLPLHAPPAESRDPPRVTQPQPSASFSESARL